MKKKKNSIAIWCIDGYEHWAYAASNTSHPTYNSAICIGEIKWNVASEKNFVWIVWTMRNGSIASGNRRKKEKRRRKIATTSTATYYYNFFFFSLSLHFFRSLPCAIVQWMKKNKNHWRRIRLTSVACLMLMFHKCSFTCNENKKEVEKRTHFPTFFIRWMVLVIQIHKLTHRFLFCFGAIQTIVEFRIQCAHFNTHHIIITMPNHSSQLLIVTLHQSMKSVYVNHTILTSEESVSPGHSTTCTYYSTKMWKCSNTTTTKKKKKKRKLDQNPSVIFSTVPLTLDKWKKCYI